MTSHSHRFDADHRAAACIRRSALLLALFWGTSSAHAGGTLNCPTGTCEITQNQTYEFVTIGSQATVLTNDHTLTITGAGGLTCNGTLLVGTDGAVVISGGGTHSVNGSIRLTGDGSTLRMASSATLSDDSEHEGQVIGEHPGSIIEISQDYTLTSLLDIAGTMTIGGTGTLKNKDSVTATDDYAAGDILVLGPNLKLADVRGARWDAIGGMLEFNHEQAGNCKLLGSITLAIAGAALVVNKSITIDDGLEETSSFFLWATGSFSNPTTLVIADGAVFTYRSFSSFFCVNPDPDGSGSPFSVPGPLTATCP